MPTADDEWRSTHQRARLDILEEAHDEVTKAFLKSYVHEERLDAWGEPDISNNPLAAYAKQMTTPGRYWKAPTITRAALAGVELDALVGPSGALSTAGYWTKRQAVAYRTEGMGDDIVRLDVIRGRLVCRIVDPCEIYREVDPDDPERDVQVWELRLRWLPDPVDPIERGRWVWAWDKYDVGVVAADGTVIRPPSWRIVEALSPLEEGTRDPKDWSDRFLVRPDGSRGAMVGLGDAPDAYPFQDPDAEIADRAYLPFVRYASVDSCRVWNWKENRGLHRLTLHAAAYASMAGRAALDASGGFAIAWGLDFPADAGKSPGATREARRFNVEPGTIILAEPVGNQQPGVVPVGPAGNLEALAGFVRGYVADGQKQKGLGGADAEKQAANPTSGSALHISDRQRQEHQESTEPLDRKADLKAIRISALLLNRATGTKYPTDGFTIVYPRRRRSPQEEADVRAEQEWERAQGYKSRVQIMMDRNPGMTREDALQALAQSMADEAELERRAAALAPKPAPTKPGAPPPAAGDDEDEDDEPDDAGGTDDDTDTPET
jgi:hypothetical protein